MMFQANVLPEVARTMGVIDDALIMQKGVWLAAIKENSKITSRMSRVAR